MKEKCIINTNWAGPEYKVYNASIIRWRNYCVMAYRMQKKDESNASVVGLIYLTDSYLPLKEKNHIICLEPKGDKNAFEDPRLIIYKDKICVVYSVFNKESTCALGHAFLNEDGDFEKTLFYDFGNNRRNITLIKDRGQKNALYDLEKAEDLKYEKNWQPFVNGEKIYFVYSISPHTVIEVTDKSEDIVQKYITDTIIYWKYGRPSGGTPPVKVGDEYYSFFHSYRKIWNKKIYDVGVYTFSAHPPFQITRISKNPLMSAKEFVLKGKHIKTKLGVIYPSGAIYENDQWILSCGYNDEAVKIFEISQEDLINNLCAVSDIKESGQSIFYRFYRYLNIKIYDLFIDLGLLFRD